MIGNLFSRYIYSSSNILLLNQIKLVFFYYLINYIHKYHPKLNIYVCKINFILKLSIIQLNLQKTNIKIVRLHLTYQLILFKIEITSVLSLKKLVNTSKHLL